MNSSEDKRDAARWPSLQDIFGGPLANSKRRERSARKRMHFETLESRLLLSASSAGVLAYTAPDNVADFDPERPILILPGIAGTFAADDQVDEWYVQRGVQPGQLQVDPLAGFYYDLVKTLRETGYTLDRDLFVANYDWRMDVGPKDGEFDGHLDGLTADSLTDDEFEFGVDYLGYWLDFASDRWADEHGFRPESVDLISHSTGGLVGRAYIQSDAYGGHVSDENYDLPTINDFFLVGVPNQGASKAWNMLQDDWDVELGFRLVLSKIVDEAYERIQGGYISGPDYDIVWDPDSNGSFVDDGDATDNLVVHDKVEFINAFVPTARSLLATYAFLDETEGDGTNYLTVNDSPERRNAVALDLNDGLGLYYTLDQITEPFEDDDTLGDPATFSIEVDGELRSPNAFIDQLDGAAIVIFTAEARDGEEAKKTPTYAVGHTGPISDDPLVNPFSNQILSFTDFFSRPPLDGEPWYQEIEVEDGGDGTVPTISSYGQFEHDPRNNEDGSQLVTLPVPASAITAHDKLDHTGLMGFRLVQREIVERLTQPNLVDLEPSQDLVFSSVESLCSVIEFGILNDAELLEMLGQIDITEIAPFLRDIFAPLADLSEALQGLVGEIPLVGSSLSELFGDIVPAPESLIHVLNSPAATFAGLVQALPMAPFESFALTLCAFFDRNPWIADILDGKLPDVDQLVLPFHLAGNFGTEKPFDLGLDAVLLELDANVTASLSYTLDFDVVLDFAAVAAGNVLGAVYIDTTNPNLQGNPVPELVVTLEVTAPNFALNAGGNLGLLEITVEDTYDAGDDDPINGPGHANGFTGLFGTLVVDLHDEVDGRLTPFDLATPALLDLVDVRLTANADVNLLMSIDFADSEIFPSFSTEFDFDWDFDSAEIVSDPGALLGALPSLAFNNIELDLGDFFSNFARPIVEQIQEAFDFLDPLRDVLDWRIPVLSDFEDLEDIFDPDGGNVQLSDVFKTLGLDVLGFITEIDDIEFPVSSEGIDFGSWRFSPEDDLRSLLNLQGPLAHQGTRLTDVAGQIGGLTGAADAFFDLVRGIGFRFPLFSNDRNLLLDVLLGNTATLFEWETHIDRDDARVGVSESIRIFNLPSDYADFYVSFAGSFDLELNLAFGFDTTGLASGNLLQGFFIRDTHSGDDSELELSGSVSASTGFSLSIPGIDVDFDIGGSISSSIEFDLHDPNGDGKVRGDEIGLCLFDASGRFSAGFSADLDVDLRVDPPGPGSYTREIFDDGVSFSTESRGFDIDCDDEVFQPPVLADLLSGGVLRLNIGTDADERGGIYTADGAEAYVVTHLGGVAGDESVRVSAFGFFKDFHNVSKIVATDAGAEDDSIDVQTVLSNAELFGGDGDDVLMGGLGSDTLRGGAGRDSITGGPGNDIITGDDPGEAGRDKLSGGDGDDIIIGGGGRDVIRGDAGNDDLRGGPDDDGLGKTDDLIFGGAGSDTIRGDAGNDVLRGGAGDDHLFGSAGDDMIAWQVGDGSDLTIDGEDGVDNLTVTGSMAAEALTLRRDGDAVVVEINTDEVRALGVEIVELGLGQVEIDPEGGISVPDSAADSVVVLATDGNDVVSVSTEAGVVHIDGLGTHVAVHDSTRAHDTLTVDGRGGDDEITAEASDEFDTDGVRQDLIALRLFGGDGKDRIIGSRFADFIDSGLGNDHVTGGRSVDVFTDAGGHDTIIETRNANFVLSNESLNIGGETEALNGQFEEAVLTGGASLNTFVVSDWTGAAWLDGVGLGDAYTVDFTGAGNGSTTITDTGAGGDDTVTVNGTANADSFTLAANSVAMGAATETVNYFGIEFLAVNARGGNDRFQVNDNGAPTTIDGEEGDDAFVIGTSLDGDGIPTGPVVPGASFTTTIDGGIGDDFFQVNRNVAELFLNGEDGDDTFELNASLDAGGAYLVNGLVHIDGGPGIDSLVINGTRADDTFTITSAGIQGAGINAAYVDIESLALNGRKGNDTFNVRSTDAAQLTTVNGGMDNDVINVGSLAPASAGVVDAIAGALVVIGEDGSDTMNVDDTGSAADETGALTNHQLTGLGLGAAGIDYSSLEFLNVDLGGGLDLFTILSTHLGMTQLRTGGGADRAIVETTAGLTVLDGQGGSDTLTGPDVNNVWHVTDNNAGNVSGAYPFSFASFENLIGGAADDHFAFSDQKGVSGTIDGDDGALGSGIDQLDYSAYTSNIRINLTTGESTNVLGGAPGGVTQIEHAIGGWGDDSITGDGLANILIGREGNDQISGLGGADIMLGDRGSIEPVTHLVLFEPGGGGNDVMYGGVDDDRMFGQDGNDVMLGNEGDDSLEGNAGDDIVVGDNAAVVFGSVQSVESTSLAIGGSDILRGDAGQDVLIGGAAADRIDGGGGKDLVFGDNVRLDRSAGSATNPRFQSLSGTQIYDGAGNVLVDDVERSDPSGTPVWEDFAIQILDQGNSGGDYIAGGPDDDQIFGQLGNDVIQGDGSIDFAVGASRNALGELVVSSSNAGAHDGDDYVEGNGGADVIFGNLGQDDLVGGSSSLFGLATLEARPDGSDLIFGGDGSETARNGVGDTSSAGHANDADMILGDNGNIYRLVGVNGTSGGALLSLNYDKYDPSMKIAVRAAELIDYTPGGPDFNPASAALDAGAADELHGESGDDAVYGMTGDDVLFGEGQDDQLIGGWGGDWISGGTGEDGVLGDDGRILASRNSADYGEPLYGIAAIPAGELNKFITTSNGSQQAIINVGNALKYTADLTPDNLDAGTTPASAGAAQRANDVIYGGWGTDSIHGGAGDDAISGAEAMTESWATNYDANGVQLGAPVRSDYLHPLNPGNVLGYSVGTTKLALYDALEPRRNILLTETGALSKSGSGLEWLLNFTDDGAPLDAKWLLDTRFPAVPTDGDDVLFGDLGNDWVVGGTGRDKLWGGWGNDLLNADDRLASNGGLNDVTDTNPSWEDLAYGGAGLDVLISNTNGDRLVDWVGEFNTFSTPYAQFGMASVSRLLMPEIPAYLLALAKSNGADTSLADQYGTDPARNGEPYGELGMVLQQDAEWQAQTGSPRDPQGGNLPGGKVDVRTSAGLDPLEMQAAATLEATGAYRAAQLTEVNLVPLVRDALEYWGSVVGADDARLSSASLPTVSLSDLPGNTVGMYFQGQILIDIDGAGHGWQLDHEDQGGIDAATVVKHEIGHYLGFEHDDHDAVMHRFLEASPGAVAAPASGAGDAARRAIPALAFDFLNPASASVGQVDWQSAWGAGSVFAPFSTERETRAQTANVSEFLLRISERINAQTAGLTYDALGAALLGGKKRGR